MLDRVHRAGAVDLVRAGLVTGQAPADFEARAENLAHAFGARLCRIRAAAPGVVVLELVRADTLADPIGACRSRVRWTWPGCRSAGARTARPGGCGSSRRMC